MTKKPILFCAILLLGIGIINAQKQLECKTKLSLFHDSVKGKKYDAAYESWLHVRNNCPDLSLAIYADGEKILKHKIENANGEVKVSFIEALRDLWKDRSQYYNSRTPKGEYEAKACQLLYDYKNELGKNNEELYDCFNQAFNGDKQTFKHPKSLYTYFSLMVDLFDEDRKSSAELFNTYDDVSEKIQVEIQNYSEKQNGLILKLENGKAFTNKEKNSKKVCESYLKNYTLIQKNIDTKLGIRANCENLVPLYTKDFEVYKNDGIWLKRAVNRMHHKDCTDDPLYEKLAKQYDEVLPSADSKFFVAGILIKNGKTEEGYDYMLAGYKLLEDNPFKKSKMAIRMGVFMKNKKQYSKARSFLLDALKLNPSNGKPHLIIAQMYASSAKNCGKDNFHKRAVFWLAAKEAKKASRVDPTLEKLVKQTVDNYEAKAPSKEDIFLSGLAGKTLKIGCWINRSIVVPEL
ncbi:hypothetical protein [Winogradskyella sp. R77965]|uniref:hypothetical protein n=1 Tax=Winogradskyella sp. R77965 TaxID=3093872 RepID=UPI0037DC92A2